MFRGAICEECRNVVLDFMCVNEREEEDPDGKLNCLRCVIKKLREGKKTLRYTNRFLLEENEELRKQLEILGGNT